jgi:hypothetical protein
VVNDKDISSNLWGSYDIILECPLSAHGAIVNEIAFDMSMR